MRVAGARAGDARHERIHHGGGGRGGVEDVATPLLYASQQGHLEVVRELLARGMVDHRGATALSRATANGHAAIAQLLRAAAP